MYHTPTAHIFTVVSYWPLLTRSYTLYREQEQILLTVKSVGRLQ